MKVLVTGGTGFVGSHSVRALLDAGHEVRMLVRAPERIARALDPLGVQAPEHAVGDVTDAETVRRALEGCDAVQHAANVFSFDVRDVARMQQDNRRGTEVVLTTAQELGLDPIVHESSFVALLPSDGPLRPNSPLGEPNVPYARFKVETERIAQDLQQAGAPVVITRPGMVWGPNDPQLGETAILARERRFDERLALLGGQGGKLPRRSRHEHAVHAGPGERPKQLRGRLKVERSVRAERRRGRRQHHWAPVVWLGCIVH